MVKPAPTYLNIWYQCRKAKKWAKKKLRNCPSSDARCPPPLHEVFFCAGRITLEPEVRLRFFRKGKWSELKFRNFWPGSRHLRPFPDRPDPISSLTELLSTHPRNRFLSNPHSLLNRARRAQRQLLAWFQPPQTVSRPSRPNLDSSQNCWCLKLYSPRCHYQSLVSSKKTPPL